MKKLFIIASISSLIFIIGCSKTTENTQEMDNKETITTQESTTGENILIEEENNISGEQNETINDKIIDTGDIKTIIDEYKTKNTGDEDKLNENDIELMEKVIEKIEKK